jgi:hypothetical protein
MLQKSVHRIKCKNKNGDNTYLLNISMYLHISSVMFLMYFTEVDFEF